ncbi:MAG: galactokinase [Spirochaetia bacterium]
MKAALHEVYPVRTQDARDRYNRMAEGFRQRTGGTNPRYFSVPGRTELGGNHTDHNHGIVLAASIDSDSAAAAATREDMTVNLFSEGFGSITVDLSGLQPRNDEEGTPAALIRGVAAAFRERDYRIGGWDGYLSGQVLPGSGLSSSASIEMLIASIFNHLYNHNTIDTVTMAVMGQYAENNFFGKPCGLMDQIACGKGGVVSIDFADPAAPKVKQVLNSKTGHTPKFEDWGCSLFIINTGGSHADLTPEYAAVTEDMAGVSGFFGASALREVKPEEFYSRIPEVRKRAGDRAVLRAIHFFRDCLRAEEQASALRTGNPERYLSLVRESGISSMSYLQNCFSAAVPDAQGIPLALALSEQHIGISGAARVHGGGFAGTIQAYVPLRNAEAYTAEMERVFGKGAVMKTALREIGAAEVSL